MECLKDREADRRLRHDIGDQGTFARPGISREEKHTPLIQQAFNEGLPDERGDRKSTRLNSSHIQKSRMPSSA